ncbi:MAG: iron-sulfur cluster assembly accessory protein [bacterium]|jgi:Fe/S biogenesis protein NfuA|nr:iron-sulfur cluster assembly accessory protein [bacterium]HJO25441.1 NifU family protein [Myxococcota bacterium]
MGDTVLTFDEDAAKKLGEMREAGRFDDAALRVSVEEEGASFHYQIGVVDVDSRSKADAVTLCDGIAFYVDPASVELLRGAELRYVESMSGGGFRFENPNKPSLLDDPLAVRVQQVLDDEINPGVAAHGGRVALMNVENHRVFIRFGGGCQGCGQADVTLKDGVVATLTSRIPEIAEVIDTTDHSAGENPYS